MTTTFELVSERRFSLRDQQAFALLSGDTNPMHLDQVSARRTQAGQPVVHGMNALLWMLDSLCAVDPDVMLGRLSVDFRRFIPIDTDVSLFVQRGQNVRLELRQDNEQLVRVTLRAPDGDTPLFETLAPECPALAAPAQAQALTPEQAATASGRMVISARPTIYPNLLARVGPDAIAALVSLSTLVGMIAPGLHSIFGGAELTLSPTAATPGVLAYEVEKFHDVFRLLTISVAAKGMAGTVRAFVRPAPVSQPSVAALGDLVAPDAFAGVRALVIGGSRGLGELTAKILAAGGARIAISFAVGEAEAMAVADDIAGAGGNCSVLRIDAFQPLGPQLAALPFEPNQIYYFATSKIFGQTATISMDTHARFLRIYVAAFAEICDYFAARKVDITAYYPSSIAMEDRPAGMTEYTMAKAAGEILCADIQRFLPGFRVVVERLPRLLTDQTATVTPIETVSAQEVMLNAVLAVQAVYQSPTA